MFVIDTDLRKLQANNWLKVVQNRSERQFIVLEAKTLFGALQR